LRAYDSDVDRRPSRVRVKPGKTVWALTLVGGLVFAAFGLFVLLPFLTAFGAAFSQFGDDFGLGVFAVGFALVWIAFTLGLSAVSAYNLLRPQSASVLDIDMEHAPGGESNEDFEARLRRLERLRQDGLVSQEEYDRKRAEILGERW
jgi:Short C-terminal domain